MGMMADGCLLCSTLSLVAKRFFSFLWLLRGCGLLPFDRLPESNLSWVMQSFRTFDSMDRTLKSYHSLKSCELFCTLELFIFQFYPVCNFGKFVRDTIGSERINIHFHHLGFIALSHMIFHNLIIFSPNFICYRLCHAEKQLSMAFAYKCNLFVSVQRSLSNHNGKVV